MKLRYFKLIILFAGIIGISSCKKFLDINKNPEALPDSNSPLAQLLTSTQVNMSFEGGSDLFRFTTVIMQMMSGEASSPNQTYEYYRYNISPTDQNNCWSSINATTLSDLQQIINKGGPSPYYTGIAKIMKAYEYSLVVDVWGKVPYSEAQLLTDNSQPHYDDDATIYPKLIQLLTDGIADLSAVSSFLTPGTNSMIYTNGGNFTAAKAQWIKLANTLKLRLLLHYSKIDPVFCVAQITTLVNTAGITFLASNSDNFSTPFFDVANQRNPISQFEVSRPSYLFSDRNMTERMNAKSDPRRPFYFAIFPFNFTPFSVATSAISSGTTLTFAYSPTITQGMTVVAAGIPAFTIAKTVTHTPAAAPTVTTVVLNDDETPGFSIASIPSGTSITFMPYYRGVSAAKPPISANTNYSRIHTFLRGNTTGGNATPAAYLSLAVPYVQPFIYTGAAPQRMITFAEYNFIRAEAALRGAPGSAQTFFTAGITASMQEAGVAAVDIATYLASYGTLSGTTAQQIQQVIEEKYIALFGVTVEPWNDWRRTGFPALSIPANSINTVTAVPRTLFYPQSELDNNLHCPGQKASNLQTGRPFWDN
jgi:hypothetical protein